MCFELVLFSITYELDFEISCSASVALVTLVALMKVITTQAFLPNIRLIKTKSNVMLHLYLTVKIFFI